MGRPDPTYDRLVTRADPTGLQIVVPGSISNLGPGFDALSVAVALYLRVTILELRPDSPDTIAFEFEDRVPSGQNRIDQAFRLARSRGHLAAPGLRVRVQSDIPMRAGLGSSAAATIAGFRLYEALADPRAAADWIALACELEGHPDNASAAVLGGLTTSCQRDDGSVIAHSSPWPSAVRLVVATPDVQLATARARRAVPVAIPLTDAVFNLQRALLLIRALETGRYDQLREAVRDRWHQPARLPLVPGLDRALALDDPAVLGVCLSGAGPSIVAFAADGHERVAALLGAIYADLGLTYTIRVLAAHPPGLPS
jgi:homoserine kinase